MGRRANDRAKMTPYPVGVAKGILLREDYRRVA
jgi:hypothetical protein